jgi:hypothetical protein
MHMSGQIFPLYPRMAATLLLAVLSLSAHAADDLLLEAEIAPAEVRVHEQAVYRLRALHAVDAVAVMISAPSARLADLREIGAGRVYETWRDGRRYHVHERSYAVFPFAGGTLELSGASVTVAVEKSSNVQPVRLVAPVRRLTVLPIPTQADSAPWLPAATLTLSETWSPAEGHAQRRTIRIEAAGIEASLLPELRIAADDIAVLPEAPRLENHFEGEQNIAVREQTFIITPTRSGLVVVPELLLQWWNVRADLPSLAILPARTLHTAASPEPAGEEPAPDTAASTLTHAALILSILLLIAYRQRTRLRSIIMKLLRRGATTDTSVL